MKVIRFARYGGLDVLEVEEPHPAAGQIRILVVAAGINAVDRKIRAGQMREVLDLSLPAGTGIDAAGVVDEIGDRVEGVRLGDAVFGSGAATLAEHAVLDAWALDLRAGQTLLVDGASGGVGSAVVQLARQADIRVIGTASERNHAYLRKLGAEPIAYGDGLAERVRALTPGGVDAALDLVGMGAIAELIELAGDPAMVLSIADPGAIGLAARFSAGPGDRDAALREITRLHLSGSPRLDVARGHPLAASARAHAEDVDLQAPARQVVTVR
jgi:NADPH:quinone reductase-like Zn-dependent oxidoreductase